MHYAQRTVTILRRFHDDAKTENIGELLEVKLLILQLSPDRIRTLGAAIHPRLDAILGQLALERVGDTSDAIAAGIVQPAQSRND